MKMGGDFADKFRFAGKVSIIAADDDRKTSFGSEMPKNNLRESCRKHITTKGLRRKLRL